ncbi:MAG: hypothetical protein ACYTFY_10440 [Planctomycetota bacterium]|jgi:hypothetical protein
MKQTFTLLIFLSLITLSVHAGQFFVSKSGNDTNDGSSVEKAFLTIKKGVDTLMPGDTLTIYPGEYHESIRRKDLGSLDKETVIKAHVRGSVVLRGDTPISGFKKMAGTKFIYEADYKGDAEIQMVNELDTGKMLNRMPTIHELDFYPGVFYQDKAAGKIYISTSDMQAAEKHHYSVSDIADHGMILFNAKKVVIDGLVVTGFNIAKEMPRHDYTMNSIWAIFLTNGKNSVIRNCMAYMNGQGFGMNSVAKDAGDNVIENCVAWLNGSTFGQGDRGGITSITTTRDIIRNCITYFNHDYGVNFRGGGYKDSTIVENRGYMRDNIAWGNGKADLKLKTGVTSAHKSERCVAPYASNAPNPVFCTFGNWNKPECPVDTVRYSLEKEFKPDSEFADHLNQDYRLQAVSTLRGKAPGGKDRGAYQYEKNIFFVSPGGSDKKDGLSVINSWKTLKHALSKADAGDTVYLQTGVYEAGLDIALQKKIEKPLSIRARGKDKVFITGDINIKDSSLIDFQRISFQNKVVINGGSKITFSKCKFTADKSGITAANSDSINIISSNISAVSEPALVFTDCKNIDLRGILFDNSLKPVVKTDNITAVKYSDYNSYSKSNSVWSIAGKETAFAVLQKTSDKYSKILVPAFKDVEGMSLLENPFYQPPEIVKKFNELTGIKELQNKELFAIGGVFGKPFGVYRDVKKKTDYSLVREPHVFSITSTTANIEWTASDKSECRIAWGETEECKNIVRIETNYFGSYSLTGLSPEKTYYFKILDMMQPVYYNQGRISKRYPVKSDTISFTTLKEDKAPVTYYVALDGSDENTGLDRKRAFKSLQKAADIVLPGDTVLIAGGTYKQRARIRSTGEKDKPITFQGMAGQKVILSGAGKKLNSFFFASGKHYLNFDSFYTLDTNREKLQGWELEYAGDFVLYRCSNIKITRFMSHERGGYSARFITAVDTPDIFIKNCVYMNKMGGGLYIKRCPNLRLENTLCVRPLISAFILRNDKKGAVYFKDCIFTDMLRKKAKMNIWMMVVDWRLRCPSMKNCAFFVRCFPPEERHVIGKYPASHFEEIENPLFADPEFAVKKAVLKMFPKTDFYPDQIMRREIEIDFDSFFVNNPEYKKRGIGLQEEVFKDFKFKKKNVEKKK